MGFAFVSIWTEIKGRVELCCTNFWFLLHFALPQSGKYRCGSSVIPVRVLPVIYLGDCSVQLPGYSCWEDLWKTPHEMCVWASLWLEIPPSSRSEYLGSFLQPVLGPHPQEGFLLIGWDFWARLQGWRISGRKSCQGFCQSVRLSLREFWLSSNSGFSHGRRKI